MFSCLHQILTPSSKCYTWNWDSSDRSVVQFWWSWVHCILSLADRSGTQRGLLLLCTMCFEVWLLVLLHNSVVKISYCYLPISSKQPGLLRHQKGILTQRTANRFLNTQTNAQNHLNHLVLPFRCLIWTWKDSLDHVYVPKCMPCDWLIRFELMSS